MYEPQWRHPASVAEASAMLADLGARARLIAGGTDLAVAVRAGEARPDVLIDLGGISTLCGIACDGGPGGERLDIGALATHEAVGRHRVAGERAGLLAAACRSVGSRQIRERGTVGGNVANASPAADAAVALLALGAEARVRSAGGVERNVPLERLLVGPGKTVLGQDDLLVSVSFPLPARTARSAYLKFGQRNALAIAIVSVGAVFDPDTGTVAIALGSVAPTPVRAREAEALFAHEWARSCDRADLLDAVARAAARAASPIDDVRASAWYRAELVHVLTRRALGALCLGEPWN